MKRPTLAAMLALFVILPAHAAQIDVRVHDARSGAELPIHVHNGQRYVEGDPGRSYEIRLQNLSNERLLAVTSVDGVNVVSGQTADFDQTGYVIEPFSQARVEGWRKSLSEVAAFYFTALDDSYAARTGRPTEVGVIGLALFRERRGCCQRIDGVRPPDAPRSAAKAESAAPTDSVERMEQPERLGTGHGPRHPSGAQETVFERASAHPDQVIRLYYDSRANLLARGVIAQVRPRYPVHPNPFPAAGFVPDP